MKRSTIAAVVAAATFAALAVPAAAYTHYTNVVNDPYGVGECPNGGCIVYIGLANGDDHHTLEKAGYPFDRTRAYLAVRYPPGTVDRFAFDLDAAAQLLANGLTMPRLDWLWYEGTR